MRVSAVQHDIIWQNAAATCERLEPLIQHAADGGAELVVLTEMFGTGFSMEPDLAGGPSEARQMEFLRRMAQIHQISIIASVAHGEGAIHTNRMVLIHPHQQFAPYDKRHPFTFMNEHHVFTAGDEVVQWELGGLRVTPQVCYDLRFADDFWAVGPTTDVFVVVANWPAARREHWMTLLRARAIENQCFVIGVNRVGDASGLHYCGDSMIIDPYGLVLATAHEQEAVLTADTSADRVLAVRTEFPFLQDRR
jgi:predicted amidohydrolase